jgi:hypothetical protein
MFSSFAEPHRFYPAPVPRQKNNAVESVTPIRPSRTPTI